MAPHPINQTARCWVKYTSVGIVHEMLFRLPITGVTGANALNRANDLAVVLSQRMSNTDSILGARYSPAGSTFSVPLAFSPVPGVLTQSTWPQDPESTQLSFTGRSFTDGSDVRYEFFTGQQTTAWPADNRYNPGDSAPIDTLRINFEAWLSSTVVPAESVVTITGTKPNLNSYVNIRQNGYWQTQQR